MMCYWGIKAFFCFQEKKLLLELCEGTSKRVGSKGMEGEVDEGEQKVLGFR